MLKECVVVGGQIINIGPWDQKIEVVEIRPAEYDDEGTLIKEAIYKDRVTNPLPDGAEVLELEIAQNDDGGWYAVDYEQPSEPTEMDRIGETLVQRELEVLELKQQNEALGAQIVGLELRVLTMETQSKGDEANV